MNQNDVVIELRKLINTMAERIYDLASKGYSKGQILEYLTKIGELSREKGETTDLISKNIDILSRAVDAAIGGIQRQTVQPEISRLYQQMVDEKNLSYIGKGGRDYYSRETLEEANKQYMDQMYTENKPRTM